MNIIDIQDDLKNLPENALMQEFQQPTGNAPQFLILGELKRRKQMREDYQRQQNSDMKTVAEETITGAGVPQEGIMQMARSMTPKTNMAQDTGVAQAMPVQPTQAPQPQMMSDGGIMQFAPGGKLGDPLVTIMGIPFYLSEDEQSIIDPNGEVVTDSRTLISIQEAMKAKSAAPQLFNELNFDKSPREPDELGRDVDFEVSNFLSNSGSLTRPEMPTMPGGLPNQELPVFDATVPEPANPTEGSIFNQLRSSVYSNNPLADPVASALGSLTSESDPNREPPVAFSQKPSDYVGEDYDAQEALDNILSEQERMQSGQVGSNTFSFPEGVPGQMSTDQRYAPPVAFSQTPADYAGEDYDAQEMMDNILSEQDRMQAGQMPIPQPPTVDFESPDIDYSNLAISTLNRLADEGDDSAINQLRLNEVSGLQTQSDISTGGDDLYMDNIMGKYRYSIDGLNTIADSPVSASILSGDNFSNDPTMGYSYPVDVPKSDPNFEAINAGSNYDEIPLMTDAQRSLTPAGAIRDNVDLLYGGSGDLYNRGMAAQMSSVGSMSDAEILAIAGDPSNNLYGLSLEEMGRRGMDFGEQPIIEADINTINADRALSAAQRRLRAATTEQEKRAAMNVIKTAEAGVEKAIADRAAVPTSVLETPFESGQPVTTIRPPEITNVVPNVDSQSERETAIELQGTSGQPVTTLRTPEINDPTKVGPEVVDEDVDVGTDEVVPNLIIQEPITTDAQRRRKAAEDGTGIASLKPVVSDDDAGGSTTSSGGAYGSIESRIAKMLSDRESSAESDKWMALAQTGMALMASRNPTFGGALGEAGLAGVGALQKSKKAYDSDIMGLLGMQQKIQSAKSLDASRSAKSATGGMKELNTMIDNARADLTLANAAAAKYFRIEPGDPMSGTEDRMINMIPQDVQANVIAARDRLEALNREAAERRREIGSGTQFDATQ